MQRWDSVRSYGFKGDLRMAVDPDLSFRLGCATYAVTRDRNCNQKTNY